MKNGSIEFVAVMVEKFKVYVRPYTKYQHVENYEDLGFSIRESSKRIMSMCNDKRKLRAERKKQAALRKKIVGVSSTVDSHGFMSQNMEGGGVESWHHSPESSGQKFYDPNTQAQSLQEKIGVIVEEVD